MFIHFLKFVLHQDVANRLWDGFSTFSNPRRLILFPWPLGKGFDLVFIDYLTIFFLKLVENADSLCHDNKIIKALIK